MKSKRNHRHTHWSRAYLSSSFRSLVCWQCCDPTECDLRSRCHWEEHNGRNGFQVSRAKKEPGWEDGLCCTLCCGTGRIRKRDAAAETKKEVKGSVRESTKGREGKKKQQHRESWTVKWREGRGREDHDKNTQSLSSLSSGNWFKMFLSIHACHLVILSFILTSSPAMLMRGTIYDLISSYSPTTDCSCFQNFTLLTDAVKYSMISGTNIAKAETMRAIRYVSSRPADNISAWILRSEQSRRERPARWKEDKKKKEPGGTFKTQSQTETKRKNKNDDRTTQKKTKLEGEWYTNKNKKREKSATKKKNKQT